MGIRNKGDLIRNDFTYESRETAYGIAFYVKLCSNQRSYGPYVRVPDMPLVRPRVHRYAFCPETLAVKGRLGHVRDIPAPCVPQGGDFVDINA